MTHDVTVDLASTETVVTVEMPGLSVGVPGPGGAGPQGPPGPAGADGAQGPTGPQGPQGIEGPPGEVGAQGPEGPQGAEGVGIAILGELPTVADLPPTGNSPGDAYIVTATGDLHVWSAQTDPDSWVDAGQVVGPQGPQGPQGIQGNPGPQGIQGNVGPQGPQGTIGPQGIPGTNGTNGADGAPGAAGATGPQGPAGIVPATLTLAAPTDRVTSITIADDGSASGTWPNRWEWKYDPNGAVAAFLVQWVNEYGEWRGTPAKSNTVPWRLHAKNNSADAAHTVNLMEVQAARDDGTNLLALDSNGALTVRGAITRAVASGPTLATGYLILNAADAVPANTPAGTLIFRRP